MNLDYEIKYDNVLLRPISDTDIENMRVWRNDSSNSRFLRNIGEISKTQQKNWHDKYINNKAEVFFAICETEKLNKMVGAISLYDITTNIAEIGKIQIGEKQAHGLGLGKKSLVMLMKFGFEILDLEKILGTVNKDNMPAVINDIAIGFKIIGEQKSISQIGGNDFLLEIDYDRLKAVNFYVENIVIKKL